MDVVPILSTIILVSTIITLIVAIASYMTFRVKEKKKQAAMAQFQDVFAEDMKALMDEGGDTMTVVEPAKAAPASAEGVISLPPRPVEATPPVVSTPPVAVAPPAPAPATTTVVVQQPPVVVGMPYAAQPPYPQFQGYPPQPQDYAQQPPAQGTQPQQAYPQQSQQVPGYPPQQPQQGGYNQQPYPPPPPPDPLYSGAQAAFMKSFGGQNQLPPPPDAQGGSLRKFSMPDNRQPRKEPPPSFGEETPSWK